MIVQENDVAALKSRLASVLPTAIPRNDRRGQGPAEGKAAERKDEMEVDASASAPVPDFLSSELMDVIAQLQHEVSNRCPHASECEGGMMRACMTVCCAAAPECE